jgi:hypothetical protein
LCLSLLIYWKMSLLVNTWSCCISVKTWTIKCDFWFGNISVNLIWRWPPKWWHCYYTVYVVFFCIIQEEIETERHDSRLR